LKVNYNVSILAQPNPHIAQDKKLAFVKTHKSTIKTPTLAFAPTLDYT